MFGFGKPQPPEPDEPKKPGTGKKKPSGGKPGYLKFDEERTTRGVILKGEHLIKTAMSLMHTRAALEQAMDAFGEILNEFTVDGVLPLGPPVDEDADQPASKPNSEELTAGIDSLLKQLGIAASDKEPPADADHHG